MTTGSSFDLAQGKQTSIEFKPENLVYKRRLDQMLITTKTQIHILSYNSKIRTLRFMGNIYLQPDMRIPNIPEYCKSSMLCIINLVYIKNTIL